VNRIEYAVNDLRFKGIKINPPSGFYPNDERLYPSYEKAQELQIPVMFHMGLKPPAEGCRLKYCRPIFIDDVVVDFPDLPIIIAHAGYPWVDETIMVGMYSENVYVDISTLNQIEEAMGEPVILPTLKKLHASLGSRKIVYGSDGIFNIEPIKEAVNSADFLSANDKENIFWKNANELLKL
jgi:predicted TIM-barrel fold metal-dependent hydrolase